VRHPPYRLRRIGAPPASLVRLRGLWCAFGVVLVGLVRREQSTRLGWAGGRAAAARAGERLEAVHLRAVEVQGVLWGEVAAAMGVGGGRGSVCPCSF
jgi:hypothetical protein